MNQDVGPNIFIDRSDQSVITQIARQGCDHGNFTGAFYPECQMTQTREE